MKDLLIVTGARPNFMKIARFKEVARERGSIRVRTVHTGQQHDERMTRVFMEQFGLEVDHVLHGDGTGQANQLARIMLGLVPVFGAVKPDAVMVVGDVTSTLAGALVANKMGIRLLHLESGLRSRDRTMPEEMNRLLTDRLADHLFTTEPAAAINLIGEGVPRERIHHVGNTMIDTLVAFEERILVDPVMETMGWGKGGHVLLTIHRPHAVDDPTQAAKLVELIKGIAMRCHTIFPLHPRTANNLERHGLLNGLRATRGLHVAPPLDYFAFQRVLATSSMVITDSGGVQEETTFKGVPCLTLRANTERPITMTEGTNELVPFDAAMLWRHMDSVLSGTFKKGSVPALWDGHATERVLDVIDRVL